jgi:hypothetical protein
VNTACAWASIAVHIGSLEKTLRTFQMLPKPKCKNFLDARELVQRPKNLGELGSVQTH